MPTRLRLLIVLAAYAGLRQDERLELLRPDADGACGRVISAPKTASGVRTVHLPPPFLPILQKHLLEAIDLYGPNAAPPTNDIRTPRTGVRPPPPPIPGSPTPRPTGIGR